MLGAAALVAVAGLVITFGGWALFRRLVVAPSLATGRPPVSVRQYDGLPGSGRERRYYRTDRLELSLSQPDSSLRAFTLWRVERRQRCQLVLLGDDQGKLWLDGLPLLCHRERLSGRNWAGMDLVLEPGVHLLCVELVNRPQQGWVKLLVRPHGSRRARVLGGEGLFAWGLGNRDNWWRAWKAASAAAPLLLAAVLLAGLGWSLRAALRCRRRPKDKGWMMPAAVLALLASFLALFLTAFAGHRFHHRHVIRGDAFGYASYLPALVNFHDPSLQCLIGPALRHRLVPPAVDALTPGYTGLTPVARLAGRRAGAGPGSPPGALFNKYNLGVAVMQAPFFLAAHGASLALGLEADGFSEPYQWAYGLAGLSYAALGALLLGLVLERRCGPRAAALALLVLGWGTGLLNYAGYEPGMSHAYSFCLVAALVWLTPRWFAGPTAARSLALGGIVGLALLVRLSNGLALILLAGYLLEAGGLAGLRRRAAPLALAGLAALAGFFPQMLLWHYSLGHWVVFSYGLSGEGFRWLSPKVWGVLFSPRAGLFFYWPVLAAGVAGLAMRRRLGPWAVPAWLYLAAMVYLLASWHCWHLGFSFGNRGMVEALPVLGLGLGAFLAWLGQRNGLARWSVGGALALLVALNLLQSLQYWQGLLDPRTLTWQKYLAGFLRLNL